MDSFDSDQDSDLFGDACAWKWVIVNHLLNCLDGGYEHKLAIGRLRYKLAIRDKVKEIEYESKSPLVSMIMGHTKIQRDYAGQAIQDYW